MRWFGLVAQIFLPGISAAILGWWVTTLAMRLCLRATERWPAMAEGWLCSCRLVLLLCFITSGTIGALAAWGCVTVLGGLVDLSGAPRTFPALNLWHTLLEWTGVLAASLCYLGAAKHAVLAMGSTRRRWELLGLDVSPGPNPATITSSIVSDTAAGGRRIVILCDGTSNRPDETEDGLAAPTNIYKLSRALVSDDTQTVWYEAGVGSNTSSTANQVERTRMGLAFIGANTGAQLAALGSRLIKLFEGAFGSGISETIVRGYTEIVRQYRPGDRIYLAGFSRGAFAARCIAGVIERCGLLRAGNIYYAVEAVQIYRCRKDPDCFQPLLPALVHERPDIEFLGAFDTVPSLGVPLWGWWFRVSAIWRNAAFATDPGRFCRHIYHALAMDEQRAEFLPSLYAQPQPGEPCENRTLSQVWFRGCHADIGGGYARTELSDITLDWMMTAMEGHGLRFHGDARASLNPAPLARLHSELDLRPYWQVFGSWPRWHPTPGAADGPTGTTLHESVLQRSAAIERLAGRFDMHRLAVGASVVFTAEANRPWHRPGIVIEKDAFYRLTYLGQQWRDASSPPCGPEGQEATGLSDSRWFWRWNRRLPERKWMQLVIAVTHPRRWPLQERSWRELAQLLFGNDPKELRDQLAPIGPALAVGPVTIRSDAPSGLLHLFANDWWQTASNNSGGLSLRIERISAADPDLVLHEDGKWSGSALRASL